MDRDERLQAAFEAWCEKNGIDDPDDSEWYAEIFRAGANAAIALAEPEGK